MAARRARGPSTTPTLVDADGSGAIPALLEDDPRVRVLAPGERNHRGDVVIYWAQMQRRAQSNAALSYAIAKANQLSLPVLVYEALRVDYPYASDRFHTFVLEGAREAAARYRARGASYAFFLPKTREEARGVVAKLCARAALVVTDDYPSFVAPTHIAAAVARSACTLVVFDDVNVVPLGLFPNEEYAARTLRPKIARVRDRWLRPIEEPVCEMPAPALDLPFVPYDVENADVVRTIAALPIDHDVRAVTQSPGGYNEARRRLDRFLASAFHPYAEERNQPDGPGTSALSPYLHFGHIGAREIALAICNAPAPLASRDAYLEELLVRRGLAFNFARANEAHTTYSSIPPWARATLEAHRLDPRPHLYTRAELETASTADPVWNAAQRELVATGGIQTYLRMQWGKSVMAWKPSPEEAFDDLVYLNDKYALDGRDANSYANIAWCFGKHDRPWPEHPIYGNVRYMTSASARRKLSMEGYLTRWSE